MCEHTLQEHRGKQSMERELPVGTEGGGQSSPEDGEGRPSSETQEWPEAKAKEPSQTFTITSWGQHIIPICHTEVSISAGWK